MSWTQQFWERNQKETCCHECALDLPGCQHRAAPFDLTVNGPNAIYHHSSTYSYKFTFNRNKTTIFFSGSIIWFEIFKIVVWRDRSRTLDACMIIKLRRSCSLSCLVSSCLVVLVLFHCPFCACANRFRSRNKKKSGEKKNKKTRRITKLYFTYKSTVCNENGLFV